MNLSLLLCISAFCFVPLAYASDCGQSLDGAPQYLESEISPDDRAVRWFEDLLGPVTKWPVDDARAAVTRLLAGSRESPVSESAVNGNADLQVHRQQLAELMQEVSDPVAVGRALQEELDRREGSTYRRGETRDKIELDLNFKIDFGEIPPGSFSAMLGVGGTLNFIVIPRRFWMQLTPVTFWQLGEVLPRLGRSDRTANSPAVSLSWHEAQEFVDELNQWARTNDPRLLRVVPGHQPNWRYSLPEGWEWMYVTSNLAANSSGLKAWQQNSGVSLLTLGGFTSMDQAAPYYRSSDDPVNWEVAEFNPMIINGKKFHDLAGNVQTWLHPNPFGTIKKPTDDEAPTPKLLFRVQAPRIVPKELKWFEKEVMNNSFYGYLMPASKVTQLEYYNELILEFDSIDSTSTYRTLGIRLIAFEADAEFDARLDPFTPIDEKATFARLASAYLIYYIYAHVQSSDSTASRRNLFSSLSTTLNDWKQGKRNKHFEGIYLFSSFYLDWLLEHPALDLPRLAIEVESQLEAHLKATEVMP